MFYQVAKRHLLIQKGWVPMFIVRIVTPDKTDFKVFERLADAEARFNAGWHQTDEGEFDSIALFEITDTNDARAAVEALKNADKTGVRLLNLKEPQSVEFQRFVNKLNLNLDL